MVIELVFAAGVCAGVDEDDGAVEAGGVGGSIVFEALEDRVAGEIAFAHFGVGIVGVCADAGREIDQLPAGGVGPGGDRVVPPFVGGNEIVRAGGVDAEGVDGGEVVLEIGVEAVGGDEGAVAAGPVGVEQVLVGVRAEIVVLAV